MYHVGFTVRNLAVFLAKRRAAGLPVTSELTGAEGQPNAYVMVADDVRVELQEDQMQQVEVAGNHLHLLTPEFEGCSTGMSTSSGWTSVRADASRRR